MRHTSPSSDDYMMKVMIMITIGKILVGQKWQRSTSADTRQDRDILAYHEQKNKCNGNPSME